MHRRARSFQNLKILLAACLALIMLGLLFFLPQTAVVHAGTQTVTNNGNSGAGSLRDAIANASPNDTIVFSLTLPATITLSSELGIAKSLTISGPNQSLLTISGNFVTRVISVTSGITLNLWNVTIYAGHDIGTGGGLQNQGTVIVLNSSLMTNTAPYGGAIFNQGQLTIINSTFFRNSKGETSCVNCNGAGIYSQSGSVIIANSTFDSNSTVTFGGGIYNGLASNAEVMNSTFVGNFLTGCATICEGGGIYNMGAVTVTNSTIVGNTTAGTSGGGIRNNSGLVYIRSSLVVSNTGGNCSGPITSLGYNLDSVNTCAFSATGDLTNTNPLLGPLAGNGGGTRTMALLTGSPAINRIPYGTNGCGTAIVADQRGFPRIGPCDIGAYEYGLRLFLPLILK